LQTALTTTHSLNAYFVEVVILSNFFSLLTTNVCKLIVCEIHELSAEGEETAGTELPLNTLHCLITVNNTYFKSRITFQVNIFCCTVDLAFEIYLQLHSTTVVK